MKFEQSAYRSDRVWLSWWDLVRLALGMTLQDGALIAVRGKGGR